MNLYFDTEFTGLVPRTTLISLGIVADDGKKFYAEFTDYKKELCDDWIKKNVIKNLAQYQNPDIMHLEFTQFYDYLMEHDDEIRYAVGNTLWIKRCLTEWLDICFKKDEMFQFVGDVAHYDFYLLQNQLFEGAFSMPKKIIPACYDICQDIADMFDGDMERAFDASREAILERNGIELPTGLKHNSLYDAEVIKKLYEMMA